MPEDILAERLKCLMSCHPKTGVKTTQKELAKFTEVRPQTISLYINGSTEPVASKLLKIAKYFNVSTDYLLGNDDENIRNVTQQLLKILSERKEITLKIFN